MIPYLLLRESYGYHSVAAFAFGFAMDAAATRRLRTAFRAAACLDFAIARSHSTSRRTFDVIGIVSASTQPHYHASDSANYSQYRVICSGARGREAVIPKFTQAQMAERVARAILKAETAGFAVFQDVEIARDGGLRAIVKDCVVFANEAERAAWLKTPDGIAGLERRAAGPGINRVMVGPVHTRGSRIGTRAPADVIEVRAKHLICKVFEDANGQPGAWQLLHEKGDDPETAARALTVGDRQTSARSAWPSAIGQSDLERSADRPKQCEESNRGSPTPP